MAKRDKQDVPFRAIVSEWSLWQFLVAGGVSPKNTFVFVNDLFFTKNSEELVHYVSGLEEGSYKRASVLTFKTFIILCRKTKAC